VADVNIPPPSEASRIARFMGLRRWHEIDDLGLVEAVRKGLPARTAEAVAHKIDPGGRYLKSTDIIPKSTLHRRQKSQQPLSKDESEKVFALSKVLSEALRIYGGDAERCAHFLSRKHPMLGNRSPFELAIESIAGADLVLKLLAKADAGIAA
jgi:putative toxin-antitoxin system antitoxin component (TIGR02293 family)